MVKWCSQVKIGNVKAGKSRLWGGENIIEHELDKFEGTCFGACIAGIADVIAANGDASVVGFCFLWSHAAHHPGVGDVSPAVGGNVMEVDWSKGVHSFNTLLSCSVALVLMPWQPRLSSLA